MAAAGNRGTDRDAVQYAPGNDPFVISVGGDDETGNSGKGSRAYWSSAGRTQDGFTKPDVMAPGAHIVSTLAPNSAFQYLCPTCVIGGAYFKAGGTSMAAPVVSGAVALMLQAHPYLSPDQIKAQLMATDHPVLGSGYAGTIDVQAALAASPYQYANRGVQQNTYLAALDHLGGLATWTRSSWSTATGALNAAWARSSWSCTPCSGSGSGVSEERSSWSRSSWSSFGEGATDEAADAAAEQAAEQQEQADASNPDAPDTTVPDANAAPDPNAAPRTPRHAGPGGRAMSRSRASWGRKVRP